MNKPFTITGTLPDGTKHQVTLTQTAIDTAVISDEFWAPGVQLPSKQSYQLSNIKHKGDTVTANLPRIFGFYTPTITLTLMADYVQIQAPGHDMNYPISPAQRAEAETIIANFPEG